MPERRVSPGRFWGVTVSLLLTESVRMAACLPSAGGRAGRWQGRRCYWPRQEQSSRPRPASLLDFNESSCPGSSVRRSLINGALECRSLCTEGLEHTPSPLSTLSGENAESDREHGSSGERHELVRRQVGEGSGEAAFASSMAPVWLSLPGNANPRTFLRNVSGP